MLNIDDVTNDIVVTVLGQYGYKIRHFYSPSQGGEIKVNWYKGSFESGTNVGCSSGNNCSS